MEHSELMPDLKEMNDNVSERVGEKTVREGEDL